MMLHANNLHTFLSQRPLGGEIVGMEIVGDDFGVDFENALKMIDALLKEFVAFEVFEIADVLAEEGFTAAKDTDSVFQFATDSQDRLRFALNRDWERDEAAGAAQLLRASGGDANDGIIAATQDVAIMDEKSIGDVLKTLHRFLIVDGDGLFAEIGAGHNQCVELGAAEKQVVERRVGQKSAEETIVGSDATSDRGVGFAQEKHDGAFKGQQ